MIKMSGNIVVTDSRCFEIGTNITPSFNFGNESEGETWLRAEFVGENKDQPLFNGKLFHSAGDGKTTIIDNFPKSDVPDVWTKRVMLDAKGYELIDDLNQIIFSYRDVGHGHVKVKVRLYGSGGQLMVVADDKSIETNGIAFSM